MQCLFFVTLEECVHGFIPKLTSKLMFCPNLYTLVQLLVAVIQRLIAVAEVHPLLLQRKTHRTQRDSVRKAVLCPPSTELRLTLSREILRYMYLCIIINFSTCYKCICFSLLVGCLTHYIVSVLPSPSFSYPSLCVLPPLTPQTSTFFCSLFPPSHFFTSLALPASLLLRLGHL